MGLLFSDELPAVQKIKSSFDKPSGKEMKRLIIVVAVIGVVSLLFLFSAKRDNVHEPQLKITDLMVRNGFDFPMKRFKMDVGRFPTTEEGLSALLRCPTGLEKNWKGPYIDDSDGASVLDPWRSPYQYRFPGVHNPETYDVWSLGPDRKTSGDDIGNWQK